MDSNYTHITFVLDRSGSMYNLATDVAGGFNQMIEDQKKVPGSVTVSQVQFNHEYLNLYNGRPLSEVFPLIAFENFKPEGFTALLDALSQAIDETGDFLRNMPEDRRPSKVIFVVHTDGQENASKKATKELVASKVKHQTEVYKWQFVFMGANLDSIGEAGSIGIGSANAVNFAATSIGTRSSYAGISSKIACYRVGSCDSMAFTDAEKSAIDANLNVGSTNSKSNP